MTREPGGCLDMPIKLHRELSRAAAGLLLGCAGLALLTWVGVAGDFSHTETFALDYIIVIVLVTPSPRGQRELKGRTPSCVWAGPQTAAMGLNYPSTDGQPHSGSLRFGGEERLKNAFGFLSWKPCP